MRRKADAVFIYKIMGSYKGGPLEEIDEATNPADASFLLAEYRLAFGAGWELTIKREKQDA